MAEAGRQSADPKDAPEDEGGDRRAAGARATTAMLVDPGVAEGSAPAGADWQRGVQRLSGCPQEIVEDRGC